MANPTIADCLKYASLQMAAATLYPLYAQPIHQHGRCAMKPRSAGYVRR